MYDYFFSGESYIRVWRGDTGAGTTDTGYPANISNWHWPNGFAPDGIDAALYSGSVCYFFKGPHFIQVTRGTTGAGTEPVAIQPISWWNWPKGFGTDGIDAALWSGPVCYFFKGNEYIRVTRDSDTVPGTTDLGYPKTIADGWGWPAPFSNGIKGALPSGSKCYFFCGAEYIRVSRGIELAGYIDKGYPAPIKNWNWPDGFGAKGIDAALYSGGPLEPPPPEGLVSNYNYFLADNGKIITGVSATINFDNDFISSSQGFSFQFNGYSEEGPSSWATWQQYVIWLNPNSTQLVARIDDWTGNVPTETEQIRADENLATLASENTIKAGSSITFTLLNDSAGNVTGCTYNYTDPSGNSTSRTMNILDQFIFGTNTKATSALLAPIVAFTFNIGGNWGLHNAVLTEY
jgi:hypothetical protein